MMLKRTIMLGENEGCMVHQYPGGVTDHLQIEEDNVQRMDPRNVGIMTRIIWALPFYE